LLPCLLRLGFGEIMILATKGVLEAAVFALKVVNVFYLQHSIKAAVEGRCGFLRNVQRQCNEGGHGGFGFKAAG
jgi:hypothetical protein